MIPLRDTRPLRRVPWIVWLLCAANVGAFVYELALGHRVAGLLFQYGLVPAQWDVNHWVDLLRWPSLFLTLISSQFLHGGWLHLGANLLYLWIFGRPMEDRLGHGRVLLLYLGCGIAAGLAQIASAPASSVPMIGASGAVAGVLGAYLLLFPSARIVTMVPLGFWSQTVEMPAFLFLGMWFFLQWMQGLAVVGQMLNTGGVAFWAHIGGFLAGMVAVVALASGTPTRGRR